LEDFHAIRLTSILQHKEIITVNKIQVWIQQDKPAIMASGYKTGSSSRLPQQKLQVLKDIYEEIDLESLAAAKETLDLSTVPTEYLISEILNYAHTIDRDEWHEDLINLTSTLPSIRPAKVVKKENEVHFSMKGFNVNQIEQIYEHCCGSNAYIFEFMAQSLDNFMKTRITEAISMQKLLNMEIIKEWISADKPGILHEEEERGFYRRERKSLYF
jgi:hypothetical protein